MRPLKSTSALSLLLFLACKSNASAPQRADGGAIDATMGDAGPDSAMDAAFTAVDFAPPPPQTLPCNGRAQYCDKRYDQVCQTATHDSAANSSVYWRFPAQAQNIRFQLDNDVRALMLNVKMVGSVATVCQSDCAQGSTAFGVVLADVKDFLALNPREVVTLLISTIVSPGTLATEFAAKGLDGMAHAQATQAPWPTLGDMIAAGHRLVVFTDVADGGPAWLLPRQAWIWETGTNWTSLMAMNCNPAVGDAARPMYLVHHNLLDTLDGADTFLPSQARAAEANSFATITARLRACVAQFGRAPTFVAVDFFDIGDPQGGPQVINGVRPAP